MTSHTGQLSGDLIRLLGERGDVRRLSPGEMVIKEGDASSSLFILLAGELKVFSQDDRGREVIYNTLSEGEVFGEMVLDGGLRSASVVALTAAICIEMRESEIRGFMQSYPEFFEVLLVKLIERLRHTTIKIRSLALDSVFVRTVSVVNELAVSQNGRCFLPKTITQQQIASRVGATREMVNHVFRDLVRGGYLVREDHVGLVIVKPLPSRQ